MSALKDAVQKLTGIPTTQQSLTYRFKELSPCASPPPPPDLRFCLQQTDSHQLTCATSRRALSLGSYRVPDNSVLQLKRVAGGGGRSNLLLRAFR